MAESTSPALRLMKLVASVVMSPSSWNESTDSGGGEVERSGSAERRRAVVGPHKGQGPARIVYLPYPGKVEALLPFPGKKRIQG